MNSQKVNEVYETKSEHKWRWGKTCVETVEPNSRKRV